MDADRLIHGRCRAFVEQKPSARRDHRIQVMLRWIAERFAASPFHNEATRVAMEDEFGVRLL